MKKIKKHKLRRNLAQTRAQRLADLKTDLQYADPELVDANIWAKMYDVVPRDVLDTAEALGLPIGAKGVKDPCWPETCAPYSGSEKRNPGTHSPHILIGALLGLGGLVIFGCWYSRKQALTTSNIIH